MNWLNQLNVAIANLLYAPGFVAKSAGSLAIAIAALLIVLSAVNTFLLKSLPYPDAERLVFVQQQIKVGNYDGHDRQMVFGHMHWYQNQSSFDKMAMLFKSTDLLTSVASEPKVGTSFVTPEYFDLFSVHMLKGRALGATEANGNAAKVAVISEKIWRDHYQSNDNILTQSLVLSDQPYQIVGVVAQKFREPQTFGSNPSGIWLPFDAGYHMFDYQTTDVTFNELQSVGRLKPGVNFEQLKTDLSLLVNGTREVWKKNWPAIQTINPRLTPFKKVELGDQGDFVVVLFTGSLCLLLIAVVNVTSLLFSRLVSKQRVFSIQSVLGARRKYLFTVLLYENGLICLLSALLGIALAYGGLAILTEVAAERLPMLNLLKLDMFSVFFVAVIVMLLSLMFSLITSRFLDDSQLDK
ncbi:MAG: ABC transporter permease, partial [Psychrosphaera sp.]|nr:ABC transporter permease [Psychrosphaera sp.]